MLPRTALPLAVAALILAPLAASAQTWTESPDAGETIGTAQVTTGAGALTQIDGAFISDTDSDLYCIYISDPPTFFAGILCATYADADICLFDAAGNGLSLDDGCMGGYTDVTAPAVAPGYYYLGVMISDAEPYSSSGTIWDPPAQGTERAPDGPGAGNPLLGFNPAAVAPISYNYTIHLTGCTFCDSAVPVEKGSWGRFKALYR